MAAIKRYVFLDRDGTLNVDTHYLFHPDQLILLPGVVPGLRLLQTMGFCLIVLTNQSGVARGYFNAAQVAAVHERLQSMLVAEGVMLDGFYFCPHGPNDDCLCRKPRQGLLDQVRCHHHFDPKQAYMIGDKASDITTGKIAGMRTILVRGADFVSVSSNTQICHKESCTTPDFSVNTLVEAAILIEHCLSHGSPA